MNAHTLAPAALALALLASPALAAPGDPDPSFGTNGSVALLLGSSDDILTSLIRRADGKLVAVGRIGDDIGLARYLPDGTLDSSFGVGGLARYRRPDEPARAIASAEQADGKVVVLASCGMFGLNATLHPCVYRFNLDGSRDATLELDAATLNGVGSYNGVAVQADGKILVTWSAYNNTTHFGAMRLTPTGQVDTTFGTAGRAFADVGETVNAQALAVQPDGKIVVLGRTVAGIAARFVMARFNADGSRDPGFSASGPAGDEALALALQPDGKIVLAGCRSVPAGNQGPAIFRLNADGSPDAGFGSAGSTVVTGYGCGTQAVVRGDGRIAMTAGTSYLVASSVVQVLSNGTLDTSFGNGGYAPFAAGGNGDHAVGLVLQSDGKLVAGGMQWDRDFALIRFDGAGANDPSFGTAGLVVTDFFNGRYGGITVRPANGKLLVIATYNDTGTANGHPVLPSTTVARLHANGTLDNAFGTNGLIQLATAPGAQLTGWQVLPDDSILVVNNSFQTGVPASVKRLRTDGTFDPAFGTGGEWKVADAIIGAMQVMADGRVVVSGRSLSPSTFGVMASRILPNGQPDTSFGSGGTARIPNQPFSTNSLGAGLAVQPDGRILIGNASATPFSAMRLLPDGSLDPSFGVGGQAAMNHPREPQGYYTSFASLLLHADGRVTLAGTETGKRVVCSAGDFYGSNAAFGRWGSDGHGQVLPPGTPHTLTGEGFLSGQLATTNPRISHAVLDAADRIVAAGTKSNGCLMGVSPGEVFPGTSAIVMRFTPSGALDTRFGVNGIVQLVPSAFAQSTTGGVMVESSGRIIVASNASSGYSARLTLHALQGGGDSAPIGPPQDVDSDSAPNQVEQAEGRDPFVRDNDVFNSARLFVMQQYRDFLGREGDTTGIQSWTNFMTGGETRATVADSFLRSAEFEGRVSPVARLYFAYFLRIPDYSGLNFWIGQFGGGNSLETISNAFAASPEFANTYGALDNAGFVDRVYRNVLGRAPDAGGLAHWKGQLDGGMTRGQMMVAFSESPEYRTLIANEVYATMVYAGMLRRAPDASGFSFWVSYLDAGNSGIAMINGFVAGAEYRARFLP